LILLDTNVISELMRPTPDAHVVAWLDRQKDKSVWICAITQAEILMGLALMPEGKRKQGLVNVATAMFGEDFANRCLPFDGEAAFITQTLLQHVPAKVALSAWRMLKSPLSPEQTISQSQHAMGKIFPVSKDWL
jgi:hypothetical protein